MKAVKTLGNQYCNGLIRRHEFKLCTTSCLLLKVRDAYKTYMKKVAKLLGGGPDSDEQMMKVFELETQLATVSIQQCSETYVLTEDPPKVAVKLMVVNNSRK